MSPNFSIFVSETKSVKIDQQEVPGSLIGKDEPSVTADRYYSDRRTLWVEPKTGVIIAAEDVGKQELVAPDESPGEGTTVYDGTLKLNDKTVAANVKDARDNIGKLSLLTFWPIVLLIIGVLVMLAGVVVLVVVNRRQARGLS